MYGKFDIFDALALVMFAVTVGMVPFIILLEYLGKKMITPIQGDFADTALHEGDVVQFFYPRSATVGTGRVESFYPLGKDEIIVRIVRLDTPSSNKNIISVPLEDITKLLAAKSDTEVEEATGAELH